MKIKLKLPHFLFILFIAPFLLSAQFTANYESLKNYEVPDWFRDAKFGIWANWGPQSVPEHGDWYARNMYLQNVSGFGSTRPYDHHVEKFGHPSTFGYKDLIPLFTAENWDPEKLMRLYKRAGARYFVSTGQHHDNFDMWDSKLQPWNAVNMGPKRDVVKEWQLAAHRNDMKFGVSFHGRNAWNWFEPTRLSDYEGPKKDIPYDGWLTKEDGEGQWWEGYDPQDLYCRPHKPRTPTRIVSAEHAKTEVTPGDASTKFFEYKFKGRVYDVIDHYQPELLYFDSHQFFDTKDADQEMLAYYYNESQKRNAGVNEAVVTSKNLTDKEQEMWTLDYENSHSNELRKEPWQTDIGFDWWFYYKQENPSYMSTQDVIHTLIDIVSKNGNMLLNLCQKADGELLPYSYRFLEEMGDWMDVNAEAIHGTRPWVKYGEGPTGFNEVKHKSHEQLDYTPEDFRFTSKENSLYAILMSYPSKGRDVVIKSLGYARKNWFGEIRNVELLGDSRPLKWKRTNDGLEVVLPKDKPCSYAYTIKISG